MGTLAVALTLHGEAAMVTSTSAVNRDGDHGDRVGHAALHAQSRRVLVWLYDCSDATLSALKPHADSFTAVAPSLYTIGTDAAGGATLAGDATECVNALRKAIPSAEIWPWITSPDSLNKSAEVTLMNRLFSSPDKFAARAKAEAARLKSDADKAKASADAAVARAKKALDADRAALERKAEVARGANFCANCRRSLLPAPPKPGAKPKYVPKGGDRRPPPRR